MLIIHSVHTTRDKPVTVNYSNIQETVLNCKHNALSPDMEQISGMLVIKLRLHSKLRRNVVDTSSVIFPVNRTNLRLFSVIHFDASWYYPAPLRSHPPS